MSENNPLQPTAPLTKTEFDSRFLPEYARNSEKPVNGDQQKQKLVQELRTIMAEEFGIETTDQEAERLGRMLVNVFKLLTRARSRFEETQAPSISKSVTTPDEEHPDGSADLPG